MRVVLRGFGVLVAVALIWYAVQMIAAESGEVVVLTTTNSNEEAQETRLWVVDHEGRQWLRSGGDIQSWYVNLRSRPGVEVLRGSERKKYKDNKTGAKMAGIKLMRVRGTIKKDKLKKEKDWASIERSAEKGLAVNYPVQTAFAVPNAPVLVLG